MRISDWSSDVCSSDLRSSPCAGGWWWCGSWGLLLRAKRPGGGRGACLRRGSSGQRLGGFIHHCFGILRGVLHRACLLRGILRACGLEDGGHPARRSEEHTSELQSLMRISYAVFCLKKKKQPITQKRTSEHIRIDAET